MDNRRVIISIDDDAENPYSAGGGPALLRRTADALSRLLPGARSDRGTPPGPPDRRRHHGRLPAGAGCRAESFSLTASETLSWGRPVVHVDLPQLFWIPDGCRVSVRSFDVPDLARAITGYRTGPVRRSEGRSRVIRFAHRFHRQERIDCLSVVRRRLSPADATSGSGSGRRPGGSHPSRRSPRR